MVRGRWTAGAWLLAGLWVGSAALAQSAVQMNTPPTTSPDPQQVRSWAAACANCHGTNGIALRGIEPLAGARRDDLVRKLAEFKTDIRPATVMHQIAKGYTDEQLAAIAGWFAAQQSWAEQKP